MSSNPVAPNATPKLLDGRRILVTGGARGLGFAFAEALAKAGARVVIADIREELVRESAARLVAQGHDVTALQLDLADPASVDACVAAAVGALGGLDGLVNNAAITDSGGRTADELDVATFDRVMIVNVRGTWLMSRACWKALAESGRGAIVNLASDTALWGAPNLIAYVASKGAVVSMTHSLAREMGRDNITVNAIAPGLTLVEATEYVPEARHKLYLDQRAIHREQTPEDVCGPVVFALSDMARFVTGQLLPVNGGFVMH
jgi:NAD(P)-dependent dehydrogenase (short-subunit alcohol dehydrogenase family)